VTASAGVQAGVEAQLRRLRRLADGPLLGVGESTGYASPGSRGTRRRGSIARIAHSLCARPGLALRHYPYVGGSPRACVSAVAVSVGVAAGVRPAACVQSAGGLR